VLWLSHRPPHSRHFDEWLRDYARDGNRSANVDSERPILMAASPDSAAEPVQLALARFRLIAGTAVLDHRWLAENGA
jgi:hypothetical protein